MSENKSAFPSSKLEALAMLYMQNQDLSGLTPEEVYDRYQDAYEKMHKHYRAPESKVIKSPM